MAMIEFKHLLFHLEQNTQQWQIFHSLPSQRFRKWRLRGRNNFLTEKFTEVAKKLKGHGPKEENGVDSSYLFHNHGFGIVASLEEKMKMIKIL